MQFSRAESVAARARNIISRRFWCREISLGGLKLTARIFDSADFLAREKTGTVELLAGKGA